MRFSSNLTYEIICPPGLNGVNIPGLIIEPLVENAIKHNLGKKKQPLHIEVKVRQENTRLHITVSDDGEGFDVDKTESGFGIYSIQERLKMIYENKYRLNIKPGDEKGTIVEIDIPLEGTRQ